MIVVTLARKPFDTTVASNALTLGTGALNIDGCRLGIGNEQLTIPQSSPARRQGVVGRDLGITNSPEARFHQMQRASIARTMELGRWPANLLLSDASQHDLDEQNGLTPNRSPRVAVFKNKIAPTSYSIMPDTHYAFDYGDGGSVSRYFRKVTP